ncbi:response regulator transcription factor [Aneurinibacillus sp. REN35]|uniref:response regulator transcription factor n=1 Tax=Aneurinibacillus sp. REN35 TaxID=3237286 RepID=UPI003528372C
MRIVIVDDQKSLRLGLAKRVEQLDERYKVVGIAGNGAEGEQIIRLTKPDIAFVDIRMPFINGIDLIKKLRADNEAACTSFIILTAYSEFEYAQQALRYGAFDYLLKPVSRETLEKTMLRVSDQFAGMKEEMTHAAVQEEEDTAQRIRAFITCYIEGVITEREAVHSIVRQALEIIRAEYMLPLTLAGVSKRLHVNESYLSRLFSHDVGVGFIKFLNHVRINVALELMKEPGLRISEISQMAGFDNVTYFGRLFRKHTKQSPSEYKHHLHAVGVKHER